MRLKNGTLLYFKQNELNKENIGVFINSPFVYYNNDVFTCGITFDGNKMRVHDLIKIEPNSSRIVQHLFKSREKEVFVEQEVSSLRKAWIQYQMNLHPINFRLFRSKRIILDRRKTIQAFFFATLLSIAYYLLNIFTCNWLMKIIAENLIVQSILFFFTIISIMQLYRPFSFTKELTEKDFRRIVQDEIKRNKDDEEIERNATF